jgi:hypothetical protein
MVVEQSGFTTFFDATLAHIRGASLCKHLPPILLAHLAGRCRLR